jgi:hypothetical protein
MNPLTKIISLSLLSSFGAAIASAAEPLSSPDGADMLRFANHDTLHGEFIAFNAKGNLHWKSPESPDPIIFETQKAHRIVLNHGQAHKAIHYKSAVHLINGDVIPGSITSADDTSVILDTEHLGNVTIPREVITRIAPKPFGGKLLYYGPLSTDGWKTQNPQNPKKEDKENGPFGEPDKKREDKEEAKDKKTDWQHIANAWYAGTDQTKYLVREDALPDKCKLAFKLAWRGSLYANVILHADFDPPKSKDEKKSTHSYNPSAMVGHAYALNITNHSASLTALTYGEDGKLHIEPFNETRASLRLTGKDETLIEIRIDRPNKSILLYSDGSFKCKWSLGETYAGKGNNLAFHNPRYNNAELRISDIAISHWNGLKDSAESMSSTKRDIILLNNGIDRFSGNFKHLRDGQVTFEGTYDNTMTIPVEEVHEIYLATGKHKPLPETAKDAVHFFIYPYGRITGSPTASSDDREKTKLSTDLLGDLELDTHFINIIDFSQKNSLLDIWDDNF